MYKSKEAQKEANRLAKQRQRAKGMTYEGMTEQGMTQEGMIIDEQGIPYHPLKAGLKGQRWYPGRNGYHPTDCACGIMHRLT